jgi:hypothetical protein
MLAEKLFLTADQDGRLSGLPILTPYEKVEVVVLRPEPGTHPRRRQPSPKLAWQGAKLLGDDLAPTIPLEDWGDVFQDKQAKAS